MFVKIKSIRDLRFFVKQLSDFIKFVRLNRSQNSSSLSQPKIFYSTSILKSPITEGFSYFGIAFLDLLTLLLKTLMACWQGDWALDYHSMGFGHFPDLS